MGTLEEKSRKRRTKENIQRAILLTLGGIGLVAWIALAPNTLQLLKFAFPGRIFNYRLRSAANRLVAKGQVEWVEQGGKKFLRITDKGRKGFEFEQAKVALLTRKQKRWDGKWSMDAFDVPERRRRVRGRLRAVMREIGFARLQDSVWIYPYDCEDFIALLKAELKIGKDVLYAIADTIEYDKRLRTHFKLPPE